MDSTVGVENFRRTCKTHEKEGRKKKMHEIERIRGNFWKITALCSSKIKRVGWGVVHVFLTMAKKVVQIIYLF